MKKLLSITALTSVSAFAHTQTHIEDSILAMLAHPFTGIDHILGIIAMVGISFYIVKKINALKEKTK